MKLGISEVNVAQQVVRGDQVLVTLGWSVCLLPAQDHESEMSAAP